MPTDRPSPPPVDQVEAAQVEVTVLECPFCGYGPHIMKLSDGWCCGCSWHECGIAFTGHPTPFEAIAAWNRRPVAALRPASPPKETP